MLLYCINLESLDPTNKTALHNFLIDMGAISLRGFHLKMGGNGKQDYWDNECRKYSSFC